MTAEELRTAATRLRCDHRFPIQPPLGSLSAPGPCLVCGSPWADNEDVYERLQGPLAALLEDLSRLAKYHPIDPDYTGMPDHRWCKGCNDEECDALSLLDRARDVVAALAGTPAPAIHAPEANR
jgi:hypothetical protein